MKIELTAVQALRLSYLIQLGKENTRQDDIKEVGDIVEGQIRQYFEDLQKDETETNKTLSYEFYR